jgi:hypothetical protein
MSADIGPFVPPLERAHPEWKSERPLHPKEIAYYNPGTVGPSDPTVDWALARPVIRRNLGQIWFVTTFGGFHAVEFENGLWPFRDAPACGPGFDYWQASTTPATPPAGRPAQAGT